MGWKLFGSKTKDTPVEKSPRPEEPGQKSKPDRSEGHATLEEMIAFLRDIGLSDKDIIDSVKESGYTEELVKKETPWFYILAMLDNTEGGELDDVPENRNMMLRDIMSSSRLGFFARHDYDEEHLQRVLPINLKGYGIDVVFSELNQKTPFTIKLKKGTQESSTEINIQPSPERMFLTMKTINDFISGFGLEYLLIEHDFGYKYFLIEKDRYSKVRPKYDKLFEELLVH